MRLAKYIVPVLTASTFLVAVAPASADTETEMAYEANWVAWMEAGTWVDAVRWTQAHLAAVEEARYENAYSGAPVSGRNTGDSFLECTKAIESGGDYGAVSSGGAYRGAYQFAPSTWNQTARDADRPDLVGVDPAAASPADQDELASELYARQGNGPWGGRC